MKRDYAKLDKMEGFIFTPACRRKYILEYFGDHSASSNCQGCDNCLGLAQKAFHRSGGYLGRGEGSAHRGVNEGGRFFRKKQEECEDEEIIVRETKVLTIKIPQFVTLELHKKGLSPKAIAERHGVELEEIEEHFKWLKGRGVKL